MGEESVNRKLTAIFYTDIAGYSRLSRQDEVGTPWCVTVDGDTMEDGSVTVRDRDSMEQIRVQISDLNRVLRDRMLSWRPGPAAG